MLVSPSPAGLLSNGGGGDGGTIRCAGCAGTAGDYLEPPDLSTPCCRCGGGLPLCCRCAGVRAGDDADADGGGGGAESLNLAEAISCASCSRSVCAAPGCSVRCSDKDCEVGCGVSAYIHCIRMYETCSRNAALV